MFIKRLNSQNSKAENITNAQNINTYIILNFIGIKLAENSRDGLWWMETCISFFW